MNQNIADYYDAIRNNDAMIAELAKADTLDEIVDIALEQAKELGYDFTREESLAVISNFDKFSETLLDRDELNDFELEMVSAGIPINPNSGSQNIDQD
jgi:hypothetical protein